MVRDDGDQVAKAEEMITNILAVFLVLFLCVMIYLLMEYLSKD